MRASVEIKDEIGPLRLRPGVHKLEGHSLRRHAIHSSGIPTPKGSQDRFIFRDVHLEDCKHWACNVSGAILERVTVANLTGGGRLPSFFWGCAFNRVVLRGRISGLMFRWNVNPENSKQSIKFAELNAKYYRSVDWALDLSEASFASATEIQGIPPTLIRRDPQTQFVMPRESATQLAGAKAGIWSIVAKRLLESDLPGIVNVLGRRDKDFKDDLAKANALRVEGLLQ